MTKHATIDQRRARRTTSTRTTNARAVVDVIAISITVTRIVVDVNAFTSTTIEPVLDPIGFGTKLTVTVDSIYMNLFCCSSLSICPGFRENFSFFIFC